MQDELLDKMQRGLGWASVTFLSCVNLAVIGAVPIFALPGGIEFDFLNAGVPFLVGIAYIVTVLSWRLAPFNEETKFSAAAAKKFLWLTATGGALALWPPMLFAWGNGWNPEPGHWHALTIIAFESKSSSKAGSSIDSYVARDPKTGWTIDVPANYRQTLRFNQGDCVSVLVRPGRFGLDWVDRVERRNCFNHK
jgi:hypothetical protein